MAAHNGCEAIESGDLSDLASTVYQFSLRRVPAEHGLILQFTSEDELDLTFNKFKNSGFIDSPYVYVNRELLLFVWVSSAMPNDQSESVAYFVARAVNY